MEMQWDNTSAVHRLQESQRFSWQEGFI